MDKKQRRIIFGIVVGITVAFSACLAPAQEAPDQEISSPQSHPVQESTESSLEAVELPPKFNPGCRVDLPYPLKSSGKSDATDFSQWTAQEIDGSTVTQEILKESPLTLVVVWGTYCGTSIEDLQILQEIYEEYSREQLNVIGIMASVQKEDGSINEDEVGYIRYLLEETGAEFPQLFPSDDLIAIYLKNLTVVPEWFFLDTQGNFVGESSTGQLAVEELKVRIEDNMRTQKQEVLQ